MKNPLMNIAAKMFGTDTKDTAKMFSVGQNENGLVIDLYGMVGDWWDGNEANDLLNILNRNRTTKDIQLNVHSYGGYVMEGLAILNQLKDHPANITATVQGTAASMASVIIMAADKVRVHEGSWIMIHEAEMLTAGRADTLESDAEWLRGINQQAVDIYQSKTGLPVDTIKEMMAAETWMTGKQAVELGFADELIPLQKAQESASAQMRAVSAQPLAFAALDVYHNIPLDCLPKEQTASLSAKLAASNQQTETPDNQTSTGQTKMADKDKQTPTAEQIQAAQAVLAAQKAAPTQQQVDDANKVLQNVEEDTTGTETGSEPEASTQQQATASASDTDPQAAAKEIAQLCSLAGKSDQIPAFLESGKSPSEVRTELAAGKGAELGAIPHVQQHLGGGEGQQQQMSMAESAAKLCKRQGLTPRA